MSEDPYLAGTIAAAVCRGLKGGGITATLKHFSANNKERNRKKINTVISERAMREIYLKPFEIAVKGGDVTMIMTAYNMINGVFCASCSDLNTTVLRGEWGFGGLVMTDWWPNTHKSPSGEFSAAREYPVIAQNDVFMVNGSAVETANAMLENAENKHRLIAALQRNAVNILSAILKTPSFEKSLFSEKVSVKESVSADKMLLTAKLGSIVSGKELALSTDGGEYLCIVDYSADCSDIVQLPIRITVNGENAAVCMIRGTEGKEDSKGAEIRLPKGKASIRLDYSKNITVSAISLYM